MFLESWQNVLQDKNPVETKLYLKLHYKTSVALEQAVRSHDYIMYPTIRWDLFFKIYNLKHRGRGVNHLTIKH
jgi:hypothetical protein